MADHSPLTRVMLFTMIARTLLLRKRIIIVLLSVILIFSSCYVLISSKHRFQFQTWTTEQDEITETTYFKTLNNAETMVNKKTLQNEITDDENADNITVLGAACRLPVLNPWHPSVKDLIINLPKLDCGTPRSRIENNTLYVEAEDAMSVSYQVISRPEGNDFDHRLSEPHSISNTYVTQDKNKNKIISPGQSGCLQHIGSKKCLHPFGGKPKPAEDTTLVFHSDCCYQRIEFKMNSDGNIVHGSSGLCLHVNIEKEEGSIVTLKAECSTKFEVVNGTLRVVNTNLCIESKSPHTSPNNDENVMTGTACSQPFTMVPTQGTSFRGSTKVDADFIRVDIKRADEKPGFTDLHMEAVPKPEVLKRKRHSTGIPVNVALIMFDSTSSANFARQMLKTKKYLKTRPTVYMKGNTIVGDGTTAQLCAMLTGIAEEDQPEARRSKPNAKVVDDWRWIFRDYRNHGYVTMYSEDSPSLASFNLRLKGFKDPPTDHYGRYFWMEGQRHQKGSHCSGNDAMHRLTFKYFLSLFRNYKDHNKFAFINFSDLTHDNINAVQLADEDLLQLLQNMENEGHLDETVLFIFGDHGLRFGKMRKTLQGKLEERLPHMSITFPTWFPQKHPELYQAVKFNSHLLTTPFDIYATFKHILSYPLPPKGIHVGQSLFVPIDPKKRTCSSSGVEDHWCPCMNFETVSIREKIVKKIANFVVEYINKLIEKEGNKVQSLCHKLSLKEIKTAQREMPNDKVQKFKQSSQDHRCDSCGVVLGNKDKNTLVDDTLYQIQLVTSPNNGFYEASVKVAHGKLEVKGDISRVDAYGNQPDCIAQTYVHLRKFCYCKVQH